MKQGEISESQLKQQIIAIGQRLWLRGLVAANDGNISARLGTDRLLITSTGISKGFLRPEDILPLDLDGRVLSGSDRPSSECLMHLEVYRCRPEVQAVVHAHPPYATTWAVAGEGLTKKILTETVVLTGEVPLVPFATPSTAEVPEALRPFLAKHDLFLLEFHGALALGKDLETAYQNMERLEYYAQITWQLRAVGIDRELNSQQLAKLEALRRT
jgi:L-fuculose-phosphate aldolase